MQAPLAITLVAAVYLACMGHDVSAQGVRHSLSLDAVVHTSGGGSSTSSEAKAGSSRKPNLTQVQEHDSGVGLEVEVRNLAQVQDRAKLEWYFYAKPVAGDGE